VVPSFPVKNDISVVEPTGFGIAEYVTFENGEGKTGITGGAIDNSFYVTEWLWFGTTT
jgi:hypothetical protein